MADGLLYSYYQSFHNHLASTDGSQRSDSLKHLARIGVEILIAKVSKKMPGKLISCYVGALGCELHSSYYKYVGLISSCSHCNYD